MLYALQWTLLELRVSQTVVVVVVLASAPLHTHTGHTDWFGCPGVTAATELLNLIQQKLPRGKEKKGRLRAE